MQPKIINATFFREQEQSALIFDEALIQTEEEASLEPHLSEKAVFQLYCLSFKG